MAELIKSRMQFLKGDQKRFLSAVVKSGDIKTLASVLKVSQRTIRDWRREKFLIPYQAARLLSKTYHVKMPNHFEIRGEFWYASKGARKGGLASYRKQGGVIGNPEERLKKWRTWWNTKGRFMPNSIVREKAVTLPEKSSKLAEFFGIMIGDGGMSRSQIFVTLHCKDDLAYSDFITKLMRHLFEMRPSVVYHKGSQAMSLVISRVRLVRFCNKLGLRIGNKLRQGLDIPAWIMRSREYRTSCLRGIFDTDGCLVIHRYKVSGKLYSYKKLAFSSASPLLIKSILGILRGFDFRPRLSHNGRNVWIDNQREVIRYFKIISSHNPKHKERFSR